MQKNCSSPCNSHQIQIPFNRAKRSLKPALLSLKAQTKVLVKYIHGNSKWKTPDITPNLISTLVNKLQDSRILSRILDSQHSWIKDHHYIGENVKSFIGLEKGMEMTSSSIWMKKKLQLLHKMSLIGTIYTHVSSALVINIWSRDIDYSQNYLELIG